FELGALTSIDVRELGCLIIDASRGEVRESLLEASFAGSDRLLDLGAGLLPCLSHLAPPAIRAMTRLCKSPASYCGGGSGSRFPATSIGTTRSSSPTRTSWGARPPRRLRGWLESMQTVAGFRA